MKRLATFVCVILFATAALAGSAGNPRGRSGMGGRRMGGSMERNLFPAELILRNQVALGLSNEQVASIKKQVGDTQGRLLDAKVDLGRVTEQLRAALESVKVDEAAALSLAASAMDLEKQVKTAHLGLLIRVKNLLTEEQQDKARALMPQRRKAEADDTTE